MNTNLDGLSPREVWEKFAEIACVPRPSRHEEAIRAYLVAEARTHGIACTVDDAGNVILRKPATPGMESRKGIILQAHMDMVPQKNGDKRFDFTKDPIEVRVDGEWVRADGTTLGAVGSADHRDRGDRHGRGPRSERRNARRRDTG